MTAAKGKKAVGSSSSWRKGVAFWLAGLTGCVAGGCESSSENSATVASSGAPSFRAPGASSGVGQAGSHGKRRASSQGPPRPKKWHVPVGPKLAILPGKGLGPIRFGATAETVGRHMQSPCHVKAPPKPLGESAAVGSARPSLPYCRYPSHALEFFFVDGVVETMVVHGHRRLVSPGSDEDYGIFNGGFLQGAALGMVVAGVQELLGPPTTQRPAPAAHPHSVVEVHEYPGVLLEYERSRHGELILAGVVLQRGQ